MAPPKPLNHIDVNVVVQTGHMPVPNKEQPSAMNLYAKVPVNMVAGVNHLPRLILNHRSATWVDMGVQLEVPAGFRLCLSTTNELSERGLTLSDGTNVYEEGYKGPIRVHVMNIGRQLIEIKTGDLIARCWLEPIYKIVWNTVNTL